MASSPVSGHQNPIPILPSSGFSTSGWVAINTPGAPFAGCKSPDQARVQKRKKTPTPMNQNELLIHPYNISSPQEASGNLTPNEREQWEHEFDRVLQGGEDLEDDLPELSDLPDLARNASKTPLRSSTCPPTPRSHASKSLGPTSKTCDQPHTVVIADSEDEHEGDMMAEMEGRSLRSRSSIPEYNINILSGVAAGDPNDCLSARSRRRWPDWAERWHGNRLRPRQGNPRYLEAHPNNDWLLWGNNEVQEADIEVREEAVDDPVLESIEVDDDSDVYEVEKIAGERRGPRGHKLLVQWVGFVQLDWIPARNCFCPDLIAEFRAVQRANLLAAHVDGQESEAESLQQLTDAARAAAERGDGPNSCRMRQRDKKGRFAPDIVHDDEVNDEPTTMNLGDPQVVLDSEDDDIWPRQRNQRSNTAIRSKNRAQSVFWHTPQEPRDGEVLWIRLRTVTPGSPESPADDNQAPNMEPMVEPDKADLGQGKDEDDEEMEWEEDLEAWNATVAAMEKTEMERRREEYSEEIQAQMRRELAAQVPLVAEPQEKEREKRKRLEGTIRKESYQAKREKKMEKLLETVRKGSQQLREEEARRPEQEDESRRAGQEDESRKAELEEVEKRKREKRERNKEKRQRKKAEKRRRQRLSQEKSQTAAQDEANQEHKKRSRSRSRSRSHKGRTQSKLAEASAVAQEKDGRKDSFSNHKLKNWNDCSASSIRRSESGDRLRIARERERERNAAAPSVVRPEFAPSMNVKQVKAFISRARQEGSRPFGFLPSRNTPLPSIED